MQWTERSLKRQFLRHAINLENLLEGEGYDTKRGKELAEREFNELLKLEDLICRGAYVS